MSERPDGGPAFPKPALEWWRNWRNNHKDAHVPISAAGGGAVALFIEIWLLFDIAVALKVFGTVFGVAGCGFLTFVAILALLRSDKEAG